MQSDELAEPVAGLVHVSVVDQSADVDRQLSVL
jgi:hypothetical protein